MNTENQNAPESDSPAASPSLFSVLIGKFRSAPVWDMVSQLIALVYPLALLGCVTLLFVEFGPSGWLWLVVVVSIVLAFNSPKVPRE
jgi:hypothetical protein